MPTQKDLKDIISQKKARIEMLQIEIEMHKKRLEEICGRPISALEWFCRKYIKNYAPNSAKAVDFSGIKVTGLEIIDSFEAGYKNGRLGFFEHIISIIDDWAGSQSSSAHDLKAEIKQLIKGD